MTDEQLRQWQQEKREAAGIALETGRMKTITAILPQPKSPTVSTPIRSLSSHGENDTSGIPCRSLPLRVRQIAKPPVVVCPECHLACEYVERFTEPGSNGKTHWTRPECHCEQRDREEREARESVEAEVKRAERNRAYIARIKRESGIEGIQKSQRFENFDRSRSASTADAACQLLAWSENFREGETASGVCLSSPMYGCGKSHLIVAACHVLLNRGVPVRVTTMAELLDAMRREFADKTGANVGKTLQEAATVAVLAIDDFGAERIPDGDRGDWVREKIFALFDKRSRLSLPMLVTTNLQSSEIESRIGGDHGGRVVSRMMQMAKWVAVTGPDGRLLR